MKFYTIVTQSVIRKTEKFYCIMYRIDKTFNRGNLTFCVIKLSRTNSVQDEYKYRHRNC